MGAMRRRTSWAGVLLAVGLTAACGTPPPAAPPELPTLDVTSWTGSSELFMEYPPLVAGQTVRFAVHLTRLSDFSALDAGRPHIEMTPERGGAAVTLAGTDAVASRSLPGGRSGAARRPLHVGAGRRRARSVRSPRPRGRHGVRRSGGRGRRRRTARRGRSVGDRLPEGAAVDQRVRHHRGARRRRPRRRSACLRSSSRSPEAKPSWGRPRPAASQPTPCCRSARRSARGSNSAGSSRVWRPAPTGRRSPPTRPRRRPPLDAARAEQARAERLRGRPRRAGPPASRRPGARSAWPTRGCRPPRPAWRSAKRRCARAAAPRPATPSSCARPIAGRVVEVMATLGASYDEGAPLFRIVKTDEVELQALVPAADVPLTRGIQSVALEIPGAADADAAAAAPPARLRRDRRRARGR